MSSFERNTSWPGMLGTRFSSHSFTNAHMHTLARGLSACSSPSAAILCGMCQEWHIGMLEHLSLPWHRCCFPSREAQDSAGIWLASVLSESVAVSLKGGETTHCHTLLNTSLVLIWHLPTNCPPITLELWIRCEKEELSRCASPRVTGIWVVMAPQ